MILVGFDIGGTFTDLVLYNTKYKKFEISKVPSTPEQPEKAVLEAIGPLLNRAGVIPGDVTSLFHASTIATNTILERKGCRTGLITTKGFRDILLIGRQKRYDTHDLYVDKPEPLTKRRYIYEINERMCADGSVHQPLDLDSIKTVADEMKAAGVESVAVSLLHSYANPAHEQKVRDCLKEFVPELSVSISSDISAKYREYERTNTAVANAYVRPIVQQYLDRLDISLTDLGLKSQLYIMQSNGGLVSPELAAKSPVRIVESGPAAGVLMCASVATQEGFNHVLTFDMGGTTAKIGAVENGQPALTPTFEVDAKNYRRFSGLPLNIQSIELLEIGSGGGSLASPDMGLIRVGPRSAGAVPGPICYKRGGTEPTVTDANLVLGYLNPEKFNDGAITLDSDSAHEGIRRQIADPLRLSVAAAAWGIHAVANANMGAAMRVISVERGRDPNEYAMVAFGGAGPLHAAYLARDLGVPKVIVPKGAGVGSAVGLLTADTRIDVSLTRIMSLDVASAEDFLAIYQELEKRAQAEIEPMLTGQKPIWQRYGYMRYRGQGFEIKVDLPDGRITEGYLEAAIAAFRSAYEKNFGYVDFDSVVEGIDWQLVAILPTSAGLQDSSGGNDDPEPVGEAIIGRRSAYFPGMGGFIDCKVVDRYRMKRGERIVGPALIEERETTLVTLPGDVVTVSDHGNLVISINVEGS